MGSKRGGKSIYLQKKIGCRRNKSINWTKKKDVRVLQN